jgi:hypothetical protein
MSIDRKLGELQLDMGVYRFLRLSIDGYRFFKQREKEVCGVFQLLESVAAGIRQQQQQEPWGKKKRALEGAPIAGICGWRHPCQYEDSFKEAARKMKEFWEVSELLESVVGGIQAGINNSLGLL